MVNIDLFLKLKLNNDGFGPILIIGNIKKIQEKLNNFFVKNNISTADQIYIEPSEDSSNISIEQVREGSQKAMRKPFNSSFKALIIVYANKLSLPAQNAFLKALEEPSPHTLIFLISETDDNIIPTIKSRLKIFYQNDQQPKVENLNDIQNLLSKNRGDRILWAGQNINEIGDLGAFLDRILLFASLNLTNLHNSVNLIHRVYKGKRALKNNVSNKLILEYVLT